MNIELYLEWQWIALFLAYLLVGALGVLIYQNCAAENNRMTGWICFGWIVGYPIAAILLLLALIFAAVA